MFYSSGALAARPWALLCASGWLALLGGCGAPTEVVLLASSNLSLAQVATVEIVATSSRAGAAPQRRCVCLGDECATPSSVQGQWPLTAGLMPGRSDADTFIVELSGVSGGSCDAPPRISQRTRVRFRPGRRLLLRMSLTASCVDVLCTDVETACREGVCVALDEVFLEDITGGSLAVVPDLATPPDLAEPDLAGSDLAGADLAGADLSSPPVTDLATTVSGYRRCEVVGGVQTGACLSSTTTCAVALGCMDCEAGLTAAPIAHFACPAVQVSANVCTLPPQVCP